MQRLIVSVHSADVLKSLTLLNVDKVAVVPAYQDIELGDDCHGDTPSIIDLGSGHSAQFEKPLRKPLRLIVEIKDRRPHLLDEVP